MAERAVPILLPCHGVSARGVEAADVARDLVDRGLAEVVGDIEQVVAAAREGRHVLALDGCAASCQARLLDASGVEALRALNLAEPAAAQASSVAELEAAAQPLRRARRASPLPAAETAERRNHSLEDYLLALDALTFSVVECGAVADAPTLSAHVARVLGVSRPTAGEMLARLEEAGYVRRGARKDLLLTADGRAAADRLLRRRRLLECFALRTLGYALEDCHERARELEVGFDDEALERVAAALGGPATCPHGWPVDAAAARAGARGLVALSAVEQAESVLVERLDETSAERLRALLAAGLEPGRTLTAVEARASAGTVSFTVDGHRRALADAVAAAALVRPLRAVDLT